MAESIEKTSFCWPIRIYYSDTDAGGVVYHANYLNFFEHARTEMLRAAGFDQDELMASDILFVVCQLEIDYLKGAKFNQQLIVETQIVKHSGATLTFAQKLCSQEGETYCRATVQVACVSRDHFKPKRIPSKMKQELARVG